MNVKLEPASFFGTVEAPPSKSVAHRSLLAAALCENPCQIRRIDRSMDMVATLRVIEALDRSWNIDEQGTVSIRRADQNTSNMPLIDCGESGSTLRFAIPVMAAAKGGAVFTGQGRLGARPLTPYEAIFQKSNVEMSRSESGFLLTVRGFLKSGDYEMAGNISSQFLTGLLMALPLRKGDSSITVKGPLESAPYVDITCQVLERYGIIIKQPIPHKQYMIKGGQRYHKDEDTVEGDWSQAAFFILAGVLGEGVTLTNVDHRSLQGDRAIVPFLQKMGAKIRCEPDRVHCLRSDLHAVDVDVRDTPDLAPVLALALSLAKGCGRITGAKRLRIKESDRIRTITAALSGLGAKIQSNSDGFEIEGTDHLRGTVVDAGGDHRIAMMTAIASSRCKGAILLNGAHVVDKSYPGFWEDFRKIGGVFDEQSMG